MGGYAIPSDLLQCATPLAADLGGSHRSRCRYVPVPVLWMLGNPLLKPTEANVWIWGDIVAPEAYMTHGMESYRVRVGDFESIVLTSRPVPLECADRGWLRKDLYSYWGEEQLYGVTHGYRGAFVTVQTEIKVPSPRWILVNRDAPPGAHEVRERARS